MHIGVQVKSYQFESTNNKLRAITHEYLNSDKSWIANYSRSDTKELDLKEVDHSGKDDIGKDKGRGKAKEQDNGKSKSKNNGKNQGNRAEPDKQDKSCCVCEWKSLRLRLSVTKTPRQNSKRGGRCKSECRRSKKSLCSRFGNTVRDASLC